MENIKKYLKDIKIARPSILALGIFFIITIFSPEIEILGPIIATSIIFDFIYFREKFSVRIQHILVLLFIIIVLSSMFLAKEEYTLQKLSPYILFSVIFMMVTMKSYTKKELNFLSHCVEIGGIIACLMIIIWGKSYYGEELRYTIILKGVNQDPNFTALLLCLPMVLFLLRLIYFKHKKTIIYNLLGFFITMFTIILTGSRTGMICVAASAIFILGYNVFLARNRINFKSKKMLIVGGVVLLGIGIAFTLLPEEIIARIFKYNSTYEYSDPNLFAGSPRMNIWINSLDIISNRPLLGYGLGMNDYYLLIHKNLITAIHNTYIGLWFQFGIMGLITFLLIIITLIRDSIKTNNWMLVALISVICIGASFLDLFYGREVWIILMVIIMLINFSKDNNCTIQEVFKEK